MAGHHHLRMAGECKVLKADTRTLEITGTRVQAGTAWEEVTG